MLRLVAEEPHAEKGADAAAENAEKKQRPLRNPPCPLLFRALLIHTVEDKSKNAHDRADNKEQDRHFVPHRT